AEARDRSWLTPTIADAFNQSQELWKEVPPPGTGGDTGELVRKLGHDATRSFYEALDPRVRGRALAYTKDLGSAPATISPMRPWLAYYTINTAFWSKAKRSDKVENPDAVLTTMAAS